jgi:hypothetical protein
MADRKEDPKRSFRTVEDLDRAIRAISRHFNTDQTFIIGSQAILVSWPEAPISVNMSIEIDAYPGNAREWEAEFGDVEASEEINALFGEGSPFAEQFGFYIDGVDERTATLPSDWRDRAVKRVIADDGKRLTAIAPALPDLVVSKLWRLDEKDKVFVRTLFDAGQIDRPLVIERFKQTNPPPELLSVVEGFLRSLA